MKDYSYYSKDKSRFGRMENPQIASYVKGTNGDIIEFNLTVVEDQIIDISFHVQGCNEIFACGAVIADIMDKEYVYKARELSAHTIMLPLQGSPMPIDHWAILAIRSFNQALEQIFYKKYLNNRFSNQYN